MPKTKRASFRVLLALGILVTLGLTGISLNALANAGRATLPWNTPPNFRVVYVTASSGLSPLKTKAPRLLKEALNAETVNTWQSVLSADQSKPLNALVIEQSAAQWVNWKDAQDLYARGTVITVLDMPAGKLMRELGDPCITADSFGEESYSGSGYFVSVSRLIQGTPQDVALLRASKTCGGPIEGVTSEASITITKQTDNLLNESDYNVLAQVLAAQIQTVRDAKRR